MVEVEKFLTISGIQDTCLCDKGAVICKIELFR